MGSGLSLGFGRTSRTTPLGAGVLAVGTAAATIIPAVILRNGVEHNVMWDTETNQVVEDLGPVDPAQATYDDNGNAVAPSMSPQTSDKLRGERFNDDPGGGGPLTESEMNAIQPADGSPATASGSNAANNSAGSDSAGGFSGGSRRKSSGGSSPGGSSSSGTNAAAPSSWPFADGFGSSPNAYPTLPMTAQRQKVLQNLSGVFPNAGQFRSPPGGWREDMAPMFTTGAFGPVTPPEDTANGAIPGGPPPMPAAPAPAPSFMAAPAPEQAAPAPALPDPTLLPPGAELGIAPPEDPYAAPSLPAGFPAFNRLGFVAPGSLVAMQMPRPMSQEGGAPPLPASLRQRYGL